MFRSRTDRVRCTDFSRNLLGDRNKKPTKVGTPNAIPKDPHIGIAFRMSNPFQWPGGKRAAISLTFDDARLSQIDRGIPIMDAHGVKGTFYVTVHAVEQRLDLWRRAVANKHEIGNHTLTHPCSGNFAFTRNNALEDYTLPRMEAELTQANDSIQQMLAVRPTTFAYPCGQKFVGRGVQTQSYVPLVAKHFMAGRGFRDEAANHPSCCDLAQLYGVDGDSASFEQLRPWIDAA